MKRKLFKAILALVLCVSLVIGAVPITYAADSGKRQYIRLTDLDEITAAYLSDSEARAAQYPNGAVMLVETSAEFEMNKTYAIDIFRQGGTAGEAKIKLSTIDLTAGYGADYRLYLSDDLSDEGVEGCKKLYYYRSGIPYIARRSDHETYYMTQENVDDLDAARQEASEINDMAANNMPHSTDSILTFADGENRKTVYIETMKKDEVTDDLEFMLALSEPENCSISASVSGVYKIKETRAKPRAKLEISSTSVNPTDDEALVSVKRTGNLGGYDSFRVTTISDTAKAESDYIAVAEDLRFAPGVSEIKVPVALLDGAEDGESFRMELSDASGNADIAADTALITFDQKKAIVSTGEEGKKYVTSFTFKSSNYRQYEFVDLTKFSRSTALSDWDDAVAYVEGSRYIVGYDNGWSSRNHAASAKSPDAIDFYGVRDISMCYDHLIGSTVSDDGAVVVAKSDPLSDGDRECDWMSVHSNCAHWGMGNISSDHITRNMSLSDLSTQYIYLVGHKCGIVGEARVRFHSYDGNANCAFRLNLQDYNVRIIDPEPVKLFKDGKLESVHAVTNAQFTDPNSSYANYTTSATFYRYDTTTIKGTVDSKFGNAILKGIYLCNPDDTSNHSSLITLNSGNFTFSPEIISGYSNYFSNNAVVIQPVYEYEKANVTVESYTDSKTGVEFKADNDNHEGVFYIDGDKYGTVSWSYDSSRGDYYDGDELIFTFSPEKSSDNKTVSYEYRSAEVESELPNTQWYKTGTASDSTKITVSNRYFSVSPYITDLTAKNRLIVTNPDCGDFTSTGTKYAASNSDGSVTVTGYYIEGDDNHQTIDESFVNYAPGKRMEYTAKPKDGYYAEWTYTDAVTHKQNTYQGNTFYYIVQNPFHTNDNTVTLKFVQKYGVPESQSTTVSVPLSGSVYVPKGTILHPSTASTETMAPAVNATVYMDGYAGITDENGNFALMEDADSGKTARISAVAKTDDLGTYKADENRRALVYYNGNYYVCDVKLSAEAQTITSFDVKLQIDSSSSTGIVPKHTEAFSSDTGVYGDTITLVNARSVTFSVDFDARNISADQPVNLARWSFESADGMLRSSMDVPIEKGASTVQYATEVKEKAKPGDHLFIAFYHKGYDASANEKYTFYGKYEVGYSFVNANIDEVMSYMPDIGFYDEDEPAETGSDLASTGEKYAKTPSAPALGPISPLFTIFGFLPTYSDAATGQKDQKTGKDLYVLEIGVQFSVAKTQTADKDGKWNAKSVAKQWEALSKIISKSPGELAQNMQTSTKITVTISFAYQIEYYTNDAGSRCYTQSLFLLGGKLGIKISIPFTIVAIPCFVYFDISANNVGYLVHTPNEKTEGYWTSKMLDKSYYYETHGEFSQDFKIQFGVGVGWDGLASIGGHIDFDLKSKIKGTSHGKMTCSVSGGFFAELLFLKVDKTWEIKEWVLLDTDADLAAVSANILNRQGEDLFADTKLSDMTFAQAEDIYDASVNDGRNLAETGSDPSALYTNEIYAEANTAQMRPVIGKISDTRYFIATMMDTEEQSFATKYYIYDTGTKKILESGSPVAAVIANNGLDPSDERVAQLLSCENLVANMNVIDCGDKLLLVWNSCTVEDYQNSKVGDALRSIKVAAVVYDKKTGKFTDFDIIDTVSDSLSDQVKGVYNPSTGTAHVFFKSTDVSSIDADTTMEEFNTLPLSLNACSIKLSESHPRFTKPQKLEINGTTLSGYDVCSYEDDVLVTTISADANSLTVEKPLTTSEYDTSSYGTKNQMYLTRYTEEDGSLKSESSILIADESFVTANPEFTKLNYQGYENTLLFFKCNGRYGYQNIEDLYIRYQHEGWEGALKGDAMKPEYITIDEDHTVGEDFKVYSCDDGTLYALWTQSEGTQQQIWGRQFQVDAVKEEDTAAVTDENGKVLFAADNTPKTERFAKPIHILNGYWGNKVKLTYGGSKNDEQEIGFYKGYFDAAVLDKDHILSAYGAFDYDFGDKEEGNEIKTINNRLVVSEFDITSMYQVYDISDQVTVSNPYPTPGETVKIKVFAENNGFSNGRNVKLTLKIAGEEGTIDSITYPVWLAGEKKEVEFEYTLPENADLSSFEKAIYYEISENETIKFRSEAAFLSKASRLSIDIAYADPIKYITDDRKTTAYHVTAAIANIGNKDYEGGDELSFIYNDLVAQADVMNKDVEDTKPFYINYGGIKIPPIEVGSSVKLSFITEDIPESIFDEYGTGSANLKFAITPKDGIGWKEVKGEEHYNFLDELGIGQFVKPVPKEIAEISAQALTVPLGSTRFINPKVTPPSAAVDAEFRYQTDSDVITIDESGSVRGNRRGTATVTVTCGDNSATVEVTVGDPEVGDVDGDGLVTILDATCIQRHLAGIRKIGSDAMEQADADRDGFVTILDASVIQRYLASIIYAL